MRALLQIVISLKKEYFDFYYYEMAKTLGLANHFPKFFKKKWVSGYFLAYFCNETRFIHLEAFK